MEDSGTATTGTTFKNQPHTAAAADAPLEESASADRQTAERPAGIGAADDSPRENCETSEAAKQAAFRRLRQSIINCTPIVSEKWGFITRSEWLRVELPTIDFITVLKGEFGAETLVELGLIEFVGEELRLACELDDDAPLYVRIDDDNRQIAFRHNCEFLFPIARTALDHALERNLPDETRPTRTLFVVDCLESAEIMQQLGLQTGTIADLDTIGRDDVSRLFKGDQRSDLEWRYHLFLVDFDVARLDNRPSADIREVMEWLADAADVYDIDPARRFSVCRPSADEFRVLELAVKFEDSAKICQLFNDWASAATSETINSWRAHLHTETLSFSAARAALTRAIATKDELLRRCAVAVALPAYHRAGKSSVMAKFCLEIDREVDPFFVVELNAAASGAEMFFDSDPLVRAAEAILADQPLPSKHDLQMGSLKERQQCLAELRRIRRDRAKR